MEKLFDLATQKHMHIGVLIKPCRKADELKDDGEAAQIVIVVSSSRVIDDSIVMSDTVTETLAVSAEFLYKELEGYK